MLGPAGNLARNPGLRGLPFRVLVPLLAVVEMSERLRVESPLQGSVVGATWTVVRMAALSALVALAGRAVMTWRRRPVTGQADK